MAVAPDDGILIQPDASAWADALSDFSPIHEQVRFREEMSLSTAAPIVMSGHQPGFFHPGVLAKTIATAADAERAGAQPVWLVVDQDEHRPEVIRYPLTDGDRLTEAVFSLDADRRPDDGTAVGRRPPITVADDGPALLSEVADAVRAHADAPSASTQFARAASDLVRDRLGIEMKLIDATNIAETTLFRSWVDTMESDPGKLSETYNAAAKAHANAGVRPLIARPDANRFEAPLWVASPNEPRRPWFLNGDRTDLAPRALLMTALVRAAGCDLFIHGTGGGAYDRVMEAWMAAWMPNTRLAPQAVVSATVRLSFDVPISTKQDLRHAEWLAHAATHNPGLIGDETADRTKRDLVGQIRSARERSENADPAYLELHRFLESWRSENADRLAGLRADIDHARVGAENAAVAHKRDWPFPLYPREDLERLRDEIFGAFGAGVAR